MHSRNRRAGILIGQGMQTDEAINKIGMVVEGIKTTKSAFMLSKQYNVDVLLQRKYMVLLWGKRCKSLSGI